MQPTPPKPGAPESTPSPEHVTPIYMDLFTRKIVPVTGLALAEHFVHPDMQHAGSAEN